MAEKRKRGAPSRYTPALGAQICSLIAQGYSLGAIGGGLLRVKDVEGWVPEHEGQEKIFLAGDTVRVWRLKHPEFAAMYAQARVDQADAMDDEILRIANTTTNENAQANRVKIDALKWRASHLNRGRYGDSVSHEVNAQIKLSAAIAASLEPIVLTPVQNGTGIVGRTLEHDPVLDDDEMLK